MICKEAEALTKWCPHVREVTATKYGTAAGNTARVGDGNRWRSKCIGSDCMMWRWAYDRKIPLGYCGLAYAGRPDADIINITMNPA